MFKKRVKQITAVLLAGFLLVSGEMSVFAQSLTETSLADTANVEESVGVASEDPESGTPGEIENLQDSRPEAANSETVSQEQQIVLPLLYLYLESPYVQPGERQKVYVGFDTKETIESATLQLYHVGSKREQTVAATKIVEEGILFDFLPDNGEYRLLGIRYQAGDKTGYYDFAQNDMEVIFGVGVSVETEPDAYVVDEEAEAVSADVVTFDENGKAVSQNNIGEAIANAQQENGIRSRTNGSGVVVVLDPGHGGSDGGAAANGLREASINLKIAKYCKAELEKYAGITVYMTRSNDTYLTLDQRTAFAASKGATVFVSLHINAGGGQGAEVYYPNGNYNFFVGLQGEALAKKIQTQLTKLGLQNRGTKIRNSGTGDQYPDGSLADYYGVIRGSKRYGIPGIIVEHGFIDSADAAAYLNSDAKLKKLGEADAKGIVDYFGLSKSLGAPSSLTATVTGLNGIKLSWKGAAKAKGYYVYRKDAAGKWVKIATTTSCAYTDYNTLCSTTYEYNVKAYSGGSVSDYAKTSVVQKAPKGKVTLDTITKSGFNDVTITWKKLGGASKYAVYRKASGKSWEKIAATSSTSYKDSTASPGTTYSYSVKGYRNVEGKNRYGNMNETGLTAKMSSRAVTVTEIKKGTYNQVKLSWKKVGSASGYQVYRKTGTGAWTKLTTTKSLSYTDKTAGCGTKYEYRVRAYRTVDGKKYYGKYASKNAVITTKNGVVSSVAAKQGTYNQINLTWAKYSGATGYQVYRKTGSEGWTKIADTKNLNYTDKTAGCGTQYQYRVRSYRKEGSTKYYGKYKTVLTVTPKDGIVKSVAVAAGTFNQVKITWAKYSGATGYQVYRKTGSEGWTKIADTKELNYTDKTAACGTQYQYRVRSYRKEGSTKYYGKYKTIVTHTVSTRKTLSISQSLDAKGVKISWKKVSGATGYRLYRREQGGSWKTVQTTSATSCIDTGYQNGITYDYTVAAYCKTDGITYWGKKASAQQVVAPYRVLGSSSVTVDQMVRFYKASGKVYPSDVYASKGAATIEDFCNQVMWYSAIEGVNAEVVFTQICLETGYLRFGEGASDVKVWQCNFGGIGATGGGNPGNSFPSVGAGIHAQVRHLKLYASTDINQVPDDGVDPRRFTSCLGKAPYVEWLSIPHNPYGTGWAADEAYGRKLTDMIWRLRFS